MKGKNANTLNLPAVMSKTIQKKQMIKECKSVHLLLFFLFQQHNRMKKKNCEHITFAGSYLKKYSTEANDQGV